MLYLIIFEMINISKKYDYFGNSSLQNDYDYLKSKS